MLLVSENSFQVDFEGARDFVFFWVKSDLNHVIRSACQLQLILSIFNIPFYFSLF